MIFNDSSKGRTDISKLKKKNVVNTIYFLPVK